MSPTFLEDGLAEPDVLGFGDGGQHFPSKLYLNQIEFISGTNKQVLRRGQACIVEWIYLFYCYFIYNIYKYALWNAGRNKISPSLPLKEVWKIQISQEKKLLCLLQHKISNPVCTEWYVSYWYTDDIVWCLPVCHFYYYVYAV